MSWWLFGGRLCDVTEAAPGPDGDVLDSTWDPPLSANFRTAD